jgi:hypothetical protein
VATLTAFRGLGYFEEVEVVPAIFGTAAGLAGLLLVFLGVSISRSSHSRAKKRYEQAVARVAASLRGLTDASKGRAS